MAANIPGAASIVPSVVSEVITRSRGVSVPAGSRLALLMGEGAREERVVANAVGGGNDGLNPTYTSTTGSDGRHFLLGTNDSEGVAPLVQNRTRLFRNGIELTVLEGTIDGSSFDDRFDAKVDYTLARVELQTAALVDQGGSYYYASPNNVGDGTTTITSDSLVDPNAPTETWTIRCSSTRRDGYGNPIDGYAKFIARGSVSGTILDGYGNQIIWTSDGVTVSNTILSFAINEGSVPFREGDSFIVQVTSGVLVAGDSLSAIYIPVKDINDPEFFDDINKLTEKHGAVSTTNLLSLGAQLAFANAPPGVFAMETAPSVPRRLSYILEESANGEADLEDLTFALPLGVTPDSDTNINFFILDPVTNIETQILPNKVAFYDPTITSNPSAFVFGAGYTYSYTVIEDAAVRKSGTDGVVTWVTATTGTLASESVDFGLDDLSGTMRVRIVNAANATNNGEFTIASIANGVLTLNNPSGFVNETGIEFEVVDTDPATTSSRILFTDDLALNLGERLRATIVDALDADFFDAGWLNAYESAERTDVDMVVPLPSQTISTIFQNGKQHVEVMSDIRHQRERILLIGAIQGLTPENVIGTELAAVENIGILEGIQGDDVSEILAGNDEDLTDYGVQNAYGDSFRVVYFYPDEIVVQIGADNTLVSGYFLAAAASGYISGEANINEPITNKTFGGFSILRNKIYSPTVIENIAANGITLLQPVSGGGRVIWGKTTTTSGYAEEEEISIIFIRDRIAKSMRAGFRGFIGRAETETFQATLYARATAIVQSFITQRLITDFRDLTVVRDEVEPRQWNVAVAVQPVYPVNWIYIRVDIGAF